MDTGQPENCKVFRFGTLSLTNEPARSATWAAVAYAINWGKFINFCLNGTTQSYPEITRFIYTTKETGHPSRIKRGGWPFFVPAPNLNHPDGYPSG